MSEIPLNCPLCSYDLRGCTVGALCPECGATVPQCISWFRFRTWLPVISCFLATGSAVMLLVLCAYSSSLLPRALLVASIFGGTISVWQLRNIRGELALSESGVYLKGRLSGTYEPKFVAWQSITQIKFGLSGWKMRAVDSSGRLVFGVSLTLLSPINKVAELKHLVKGFHSGAVDLRQGGCK